MYVCMYVRDREQFKINTFLCGIWNLCLPDGLSIASAMSFGSYFDHISVASNELTGQLAAGGVALVWR